MTKGNATLSIVRQDGTEVNINDIGAMPPIPATWAAALTIAAARRVCPDCRRAHRVVRDDKTLPGIVGWRLETCAEETRDE